MVGLASGDEIEETLARVAAGQLFGPRFGSVGCKTPSHLVAAADFVGRMSFLRIPPGIPWASSEGWTYPELYSASAFGFASGSASDWYSGFAFDFAFVLAFVLVFALAFALAFVPASASASASADFASVAFAFEVASACVALASSASVDSA